MNMQLNNDYIYRCLFTQPIYHNMYFNMIQLITFKIHLHVVRETTFITAIKEKSETKTTSFGSVL